MTTEYEDVDDVVVIGVPAQGPMGPQGDEGVPGPQGAQGIPGPRGRSRPTGSDRLGKQCARPAGTTGRSRPTGADRLAGAARTARRQGRYWRCWSDWPARRCQVRLVRRDHRALSVRRVCRVSKATLATLVHRERKVTRAILEQLDPQGPIGNTGPQGPVGPVPEAPTDGGLYGRQSSGWTAVPAPPAAATAAEFIANSAPTKMLTSGATWGAAAPATLTESANVATPNLATALDFVWSIGGAGRTLANPTGGKAGQKGLIFLLPGASGTITTWGTAYKFAGGAKPTLTVSGTDVLSYVVGGDGTTMYCTFSAGFA